MFFLLRHQRPRGGIQSGITRQQRIVKIDSQLLRLLNQLDWQHFQIGHAEEIVKLKPGHRQADSRLHHDAVKSLIAGPLKNCRVVAGNCPDGMARFCKSIRTLNQKTSVTDEYRTCFNH